MYECNKCLASVKASGQACLTDVAVNGTGASSGYDHGRDNDSHRPAGTGKYTEYTADIVVLCTYLCA